MTKHCISIAEGVFFAGWYDNEYIGKVAVTGVIDEVTGDDAAIVFFLDDDGGLLGNPYHMECISRECSLWPTFKAAKRAERDLRRLRDKSLRKCG